MIDDTRIPPLQGALEPSAPVTQPAPAPREEPGTPAAPAVQPAAAPVEAPPPTQLQAPDATGTATLTATEVAPAPDAVPLPPVQPVPMPAPLPPMPGPQPLAPELHVEIPQADDAEPENPAPATGTAPEKPATLADEASAPQPQDEYWRDVLTGNLFTVPESVRERAGCNDLSLEVEEQNYRLAQSINRSWFVDNRGRSREEVAANWPAHRAALADELGVADDETEVFCALSLMHNDLARRDAAKRIYTRSFCAGLADEEYTDDTEALDSVAPEDRAAMDALGVRSYQDGADLRAKWLPLAQRVADGMEVFAGMEEEAPISPRAFAGMPELVAALDRLCELKPKDQELVIYIAADIARKNRDTTDAKDSTPSRMLRGALRSMADTTLNFAQISDYIGMGTIDNVGRLIGGELGYSMRHEAEKWDERSRMAYRLRRISQQEVSPLYLPEDADKISSYAIDAAEGTPAALLAFCGPLGFTALASSGMGASIAEARARAPEGDRDLQMRAAIAAGMAQAAIYVGMTRVGGKMLENSISTFMASRGAGAAAFSMNGLKTAGAMSLHGAELMAAGKLSQATDLGSQELAAHLSGTASNIDWEQYGDNLTDIEMNLHEAAGTLPFLLIGSGRASLRHFRTPQFLLGKKALLDEWGVKPEEQEEIFQKENIDEQTFMLQNALRKSKRWSAPEFLPEVLRAMGLLNVDYFRGFQQEEAIRDFLHMPAEVSHVKEPEPIVRTVEEMEGLPEHVADRRSREFPRNQRYKDAMQLWDSWWQKSHIAEYTGPYFRAMLEGKPYNNPRSDRSAAYQIILGGEGSPIPARLHNSGVDAPRSEAERRALLRDTAKEIQDLSYQFIMSVFPMDTLIKRAYDLKSPAKDAERTRQNMVGQVGRAVLSMALNVPPHMALDELRTYMSRYLINRRHRARGIPPEWLSETTDPVLRSLPDRTADFDHYDLGGNYEMREMLRIMGGFSACAYRMVNLLPMCSDFSTALARGMTPAQAFDHLTSRELGYDPEKVAGYPLGEIRKTANISNMQLFGEEAHQRFSLYSDLTGTAKETRTANGGTFWRIRLPDGSFTRWHNDEQAATNDLAITTAPYFAPMGDKYFHWLRFFHSKHPFDLGERPTASYQEFCGFDQLAGIAARDFKARYLQDATRAIPGFFLKPLRKSLCGHSKLDVTDIRTQRDDSREAGGEVVVDSLSTLTPYQLVNARLNAFWKRMLDSRYIPAEKVMDFLQGQGLLDQKQRADLEQRAIPPRFPKNPDTPLNQTPPADIGGRNRVLATRMAGFHTLHFFAHADEHPLPPSVRRWFGMAPFCPPLPPEQCVSPVAPRVSLRIGYGPGGRTALAWSNRMTAMKLQRLAPELARIRKEVPTDSLPPEIGELFRLADGEDPAWRYEQGWCFQYGREGVFRSNPQYVWNLLISPRRAWAAMPPEEKADLTARVRHAAIDDPAPAALDAAGRGEDVDYMEEAVNALDDALHRLPDLHRYAPVPGDPTRIRVLELQDPAQEDPSVENPQMDPVSVDMEHYLTGKHITYREIPMPEELKDDPEAQQAMRFHNLLRITTTQRPYVVHNTIWWKGEPYGGLLGKRPAGTSNWDLEEPLENLFHLLHNIDKLNSVSPDGAEICGVPLRGADWTLEDLDDMRAVTLLRWPRNKSRLCRLMPGFPEASTPQARTPYLVLNYRGVYVGSHRRMIHDAQDLHASYAPLEAHTRKFFHQETFHETGEHIHPVHLEEWRRGTLEHTLQALSAWPEHRQELLDDPRSGVHGLNELLLRLCEDTGFSHQLNPREPLGLSLEEAHVVNIAHSIMRCMQEDNSPEALQALSDSMRPLDTDPGLREAVLDTLSTCNDYVERTTYLQEKNEADQRKAVQDSFMELFFPAVEGKTPPSATAPRTRRGRSSGDGAPPPPAP